MQLDHYSLGFYGLLALLLVGGLFQFLFLSSS